MANIQPFYSHGGVTMSGFVAVPGTTISAGRPISISQATQNPAIQIFFVGTSCTVLIEGNGGPLDSTGNPPSTDWIDYSSGGFALTTGQSLSKFLPRVVPYYRTRISAIVLGGGSGLVSYVPCIIGPGGIIASASYPFFDSGTRTS
jgi:hypothetical protein